MVSSVLSYFIELPFWQLMAVMLSITYVILVANNNPWCWPAAFASTLIFTVIFYDVNLLMESLLNGYYMAMAIYGWYQWQLSPRAAKTKHLPIIRWPVIYHFRLVTLLSLLSLVIGWFMDNYTQADYAYLDTFTTVFAIATTYLVAIKLYENWYYWLVINTLSVYLYSQKGLEPTAALAIFNTMMCFVGIYRWQQNLRQELNCAQS